MNLTLILLEQQNTEYKYLRQTKISGYAPISDQLDMLYHDIKNGNVENGSWIQAIDSIKEKYPKPD